MIIKYVSAFGWGVFVNAVFVIVLEFCRILVIGQLALAVVWNSVTLWKLNFQRTAKNVWATGVSSLANEE